MAKIWEKEPETPLKWGFSNSELKAHSFIFLDTTFKTALITVKHLQTLSHSWSKVQAK